MERLSDERLISIINGCIGPNLVTEEQMMARELLELRKQCLSWQQAFERGCDDMGVLNKRLAAAEKVINLLRDDPTWEQAEAIEAYDKVVKGEKDNG